LPPQDYQKKKKKKELPLQVLTTYTHLKSILNHFVLLTLDYQSLERLT